MKFLSLMSTVALLLSPLYGAPPQLSELSSRAAARILEQGTWGPTPAAIEDLQSSGFEAWLQGQFAAPVSGYPDQPLLNSAGNANTDLTPVQRLFFQNALTGPDQLRQRVAFALSEIWVISELEIDNAQAFPPYLRLLQNDAFGNYETLMYDMTLNPGMGKFLNMVNNDKASVSKGTAANENYARELMQLFTLGLSRMNMDGSTYVDGNGQPVATYAQADVSNLARVFTGWTYPTMPGRTKASHNPDYYIGAMIATEGNHDTGAKAFLGNSIAAGQTADAELREALHIIFLQPSLPPFVSKQLIQHLVTSNPSGAFVERVANVFVNNGAGVRGDLKAVVAAILKDPEARSGDGPWQRDAGNQGHMREPVLFLANLLRGLNASINSTSAVYNYAAYLGQQLFYAPSVFSYFSPSYEIGRNVFAPEFQLYSTQTSASRINVAYVVCVSGKLDSGTVFDLSGFTGAATTTQSLLYAINTEFFHGDMSEALQSAITEALLPLSSSTSKAQTALYLALSSGEYQILH